MRKEKEQAMALRLQGYSYNEINEKLGIPKATLSGWFTGIVLSPAAQNRIKKRVQAKSIAGLIKRNKLQTHLARKKSSEIRIAARGRIKKLSPYELLLVGTALYWAEGYKKPMVRNGQERTYHAISFTNADPVMVKIFIKFLKNILNIPNDKIQASLRIFKHINEKEALNYWQKITGLNANNFKKTYYGISKSSQGKRPFNRLPYGTIQIRIGDTNNFHKIMGFINGLMKQVI